MRRKLPGDAPPSASAGGGSVPSEADLTQLSTAISAGEDLGPFVRRAFACGRPEPLLSSLRAVARDRESEIEELCRAHFHDFIRAVDDLRSLLADADVLKGSLSTSHSALLSSAAPLLASLESFLAARALAGNLSSALASSRRCVRLLALAARANDHLQAGNHSLYLALRAVDAIDLDLASGPEPLPLPALRRMLLSLVPAVRVHAEREISREFADWMVSIRAASRHLGQVAISRSAATRQRQEELRSKHRPLEESITLDDDGAGDLDDFAAATAMSDVADGAAAASFDLTQLYRAMHIHQTLALGERFKKYYLENRKLQLTSDFDVIAATPFLESHQVFFAQIAGFFIVEDRVFRTGGGLTSRADVDALWEAAVGKMVSVLQDNFSRMQTANHLLLITDYAALLAATMRRYSYPVGMLLDVLAKHRDKYHDLLLADCRRQVAEALAADKFDQMLMRKEYEYSMNVLAFGIQSSDITPAFPYVAPFSCTVPDICRIVRSFIEDSVSFMAHGGGGDTYAAVKKYLGRILSEVVDASIQKLVDSGGGLSVSQAMQVAANMSVMERACEFFTRHAAQLCGVPLRAVERGRRDFLLRKSRDAAEALLLRLLCSKVDEFMQLSDGVNWIADDPPAGGNEYANEVTIYLETLTSTAQQILPLPVLRRVLVAVLVHISDSIIALFLSDSVKRFSANAVVGIDTDLKMFETFVESMSSLFVDSDQDSAASEMKAALVEARQLVNLLMSNSPENFLNPVIREKSYNKLDYKKVAAISEKFRDASESYFSQFGTRGNRQNPKKKSLDTLIKRLREAS
ncbi:exocyst complex component SEC15B [Lolium rigidum]|uniref:exocyst complex component SEC15B n=1 Tax=Lolium rigidum TaxID=89674 RepID=UPI001F5C1C01|nr:exocyst complex component SEC15B [Lolium rigidum]